MHLEAPKKASTQQTELKKTSDDSGCESYRIQKLEVSMARVSLGRKSQTIRF
jgi:hypothetical protein